MARKKRWTYGETANGISTLELSSWKYFHDYIHQEILEFPEYIWRGHGSSHWELESTLERKLTKTPKALWPDKTRHHLEHFKMDARGRRGSNPATLKDDNEWWALGQHHGLATPLLDWTASPFVALYFAFSDPAPSPKGSRSVYALHKSEAVDAGVELINPLMDENQRLVNQTGLFTRSPDNKTITEAIHDYYDGAGILLLKINIPNRDRIKCLKTLSRMNINHATLFPDLYGAGINCNNKLEIDGY